MIKLLPYMLRSAWRNRLRTVLTLGGVGVAVFLITGLAAILESRQTAVSSVSQTLLVVSEKGKWWPTKSEIPGDRGLVQQIEEKVPGVLEATPLVIKQNQWMSSGGGLVKIAGVDKDKLRSFYEIEVDPEVWKEFKARRNGALIGAGIARDRDMKSRYVWEAGKEFAMADFDGLTLYMAGTFTPRDPTLASVIITGDIFLQEVDERRGITNQVLVRIAHRDDVQAISEGIDKLQAPVKLHTESMQNALDLAIADLDDLLRYVGHVILIVAVVILVGLVNATSMSVRDRVREVGVLRSLGFRRRGVTAVIAGESFLLAFTGGVIGCIGAWAALIAGGLNIAVASYSFPVRVSLTVGLLAVVAAALVGILGGLPAAVRASRRPITDSLRSVD